jgi:sec-independent protein translocase protein TatB
MNLFGVGPLEIFVVIVIAVIVLGPERIPEVAVQLARGIKFLRGYANETTSSLRSELADLTREYEDLRKELNDFKRGVLDDMTSVTDEVDRTLKEARPILEGGGDPPPPDRPAKRA